jgi:hypothetical protein
LSQRLSLFEIGGMIGHERCAESPGFVRAPVLFGKHADLNFGKITLNGILQESGV